MNSFLITYELTQPDEYYNDLRNTLHSYEQHWQHLANTWIIKSNHTVEKIKLTLRPHMKPDDKLLVVKMAGGIAYGGISNEAIHWLKEHV